MSEHEESAGRQRDGAGVYVRKARPDGVLKQPWRGVRMTHRLVEAVSRRWRELAVRVRCRSRLRGIAIPRPFALDAFCAQVAEARERPLHLATLPRPTDPALPTGLWLNGEAADYVFYDGQTSELHQQQIVLHEIGHMFFGHDDEFLDDNDVLFRGPGDPLRIDVVGQIHARRRYSTLQEREAEEFATLLLEKIGEIPKVPRRAGFTPRMAAALGYGSHH